MKTKWSYIKLCLVAFSIIGVYTCANQRNGSRKVSSTAIRFIGNNQLFLTEANVSKLLIQNKQALTKQHKEIIDLNAIEDQLNANDLIKQAQVFMGINGTVYVNIEQKQPIARIQGKKGFYIDEEGGYMSLSDNYTARVPLVSGNVTIDNHNIIFKFANTIYNDTFLKKHIIHIHQNKDNSIDFKIRGSDIIVKLGSVNHLKKKLNNFKAFYQKAIKDNRLHLYETINLKFDKQVICTKKGVKSNA